MSKWRRKLNRGRKEAGLLTTRVQSHILDKEYPLVAVPTFFFTCSSQG
jgi:hypothetical protein